MALQTNGRILVGGNFTTLGGGASTRRDFIGPLNSDETVDTSFQSWGRQRCQRSRIQVDGKITGDNSWLEDSIVGPTGFGNATVVVRAIGPSLAGVGLAGALQDPTLELNDSNGLVLAFNNNWKDSQQNEIMLDMLVTSDERESAIEADLMPGAYAAIVRGLNSAGFRHPFYYHYSTEHDRHIGNSDVTHGLS